VLFSVVIGSVSIFFTVFFMLFELVYSPILTMTSKANEVFSGSKGTKRTCITDFDKEIEMIEYKEITKEVQFLICFH